MLAEGDLAAVRTAGPFEVPWSVALLPDGSFLVTERPGRLQHVRSMPTPSISGIPPVLYVGPWRPARYRGRSRVRGEVIVYLSYLQGNETASTVRVLRARFDEDSETLTNSR